MAQLIIGQELQAEAAAKHQLTVGAVVSALTAMAKLAGLWVDRAENINGHYGISDKPLSEREWEDQYARKHQLGLIAGPAPVCPSDHSTQSEHIADDHRSPPIGRAVIRP